MNSLEFWWIVYSVGAIGGIVAPIIATAALIIAIKNRRK